MKTPSRYALKKMMSTINDQVRLRTWQNIVISLNSINKIFEERYNTKDKSINNLVNDCKKIVDDLRNN